MKAHELTRAYDRRVANTALTVMNGPTVFTACGICEARCGLAVTVADGKVLRIGPDKANPHNWSDFCAKGRTAHEMVDHPHRILAPMKWIGDRYVEVPWERAIAEIAAQIKAIVDEDGPEAVGLYYGNPVGWSGSNAIFMTGLLSGIGTHNKFAVGSVDQNALHVVCKNLYGSELVMLVPDVDSAQCMLLLGMNPAVSRFAWVGSVPNGWKRALAAKNAGADLIIVDPRRTESAEMATLHVEIQPGTDWAFLLAVVKTILGHGWHDRAACSALAEFDAVAELVEEADLNALSHVCGVTEETIVDVARRFATAPTGFCMSATGVALNVTGTVGEWLSHVLNLICGRIDRPGGRVFEPGYLDTTKLFAAFSPPSDHRSRVRNLPTIAGAHALAELADEILTPGRGRIRAMILNCGNPVISGPDGDRLDHAFETLDLLIAVDLVQRESHRHADWLIPGSHWLERDDLLWVWSNAQDIPFAQYTRKAVDIPPNVKEEWEFFTDLALALKAPLFGIRGFNTFIRVTRHVARLTGRPSLAFNPEWVYRILVRTGRRVRFRDIKAATHGLKLGDRSYGNLKKSLRTPDKAIHLAWPAVLGEARRLLDSIDPGAKQDPAYPFIMIGRRQTDSMNSWINELPGLHRRTRGNVAELHPQDAAEIGVADGDLVQISSPLGSIIIPAELSDGVRRGVIAVAHGWGSGVMDPRGATPVQRYGANRNRLTSAAAVDPFSQTPALNCTPVRVEACPP